jgi:hypothetical protein
MGAHAGPNTNEDGLVFAYDMGPNPGVNKSWKGKPTTNIISSQGIGGASGITYTYVTDEDGWSKYSISGTWASGTYPWSCRINSTTLTGGVAYSARFLIKTNVREKYATFPDTNVGIHYVNDGNMTNGGTTSSTSLGYDRNGLEIIDVRNDGFIYSTGFANPTTTQVGYFHSRPLADGTSFNSSTDFIWVKEIQVEENSFTTPYVNGTRSNTQAILDWTGNNTITANSLTYNSDGTFEFDNSNPDEITVPHSSIGHPTTSYTSEAWVWADSSQDNLYPRIWDKSQILVHISQTSPFTIAQNTSTSGGLRQVSVGSAFTHSTWTHIATSYDGQVGKIYVNGSLVSTNDFGSVLNPSTGTVILTIGGNSDINRQFNGKIGQIRLYWDKVLTADEVLNNFAASRGRYGI